MPAGRPVWVKRDVVPLYIFHTGKTRPSLRHIRIDLRSSEGMVFLWGPVVSRFFWRVYGQVCSGGPWTINPKLEDFFEKNLESGHCWVSGLVKVSKRACVSSQGFGTMNTWSLFRIMIIVLSTPTTRC